LSRLFYLSLFTSFVVAKMSLAEDKVDFARDIFPIFKERCYSCHDANKKRSGYRIDIRSEALQGGESGKRAIVAKKSQESELVKRITSKEDDVRMPSKGESLSDKQIALIKQWIDEGASWPDTFANEGKAKHWAFISPQRTELPSVQKKEWVRNPIDRFILARLEKENLSPSSEADKITLCRRLYLDLIGLPPTPKEVDDFVKDTSSEVYEKLVDKLLNSQHYGERWGRLWLDAARYADSDGFEKDKPRFAWFYRDWVINSLNKDIPYDRFIIEQIAGDLLPNATQDQIVATGYLRNSMINEEGGIDPEQFRMEAMFDRMDAIGKGVLGLTIQCAQCHTHKFDPLTHTEYYQMFAFLNNAYESNVTVYTPEEQMKRAEIFRQIKDLESDLKHKNSDWPKRMQDWEKVATQNQPNWTVIRPRVLEESTGGQKYLLQEDGSFLAQGYAPTKHKVHLSIKVDHPVITAFRLELLNDPNLPRNGPGRSIEGTGALTEFEVEATPADNPLKLEKVKFKKATADVNIPSIPIKSYYHDKGNNAKRLLGPIDYAIDGKGETGWGTDIDPGRRNQPRKAVFTLDKPINNPKGTIFNIYLQQNLGGWNSDDNQNHNLGRFRLSVTDTPEAVADPVPMKVREILATPSDKRNPAQIDAIFSYCRTTVSEWKEANDKIEALWKQHPEGSTQLALTEQEKSRTTSVLKRGDFLKPLDAVEPGVPAFLHSISKNSALNRLGFAQWLVDKKSPTTARSFVNRIWQAYFGIGIVSSSEDFGTQSETPSNQELLDWLACEFMDSGWKIKQLHKLVVMSSTYRQSSKVTKELLAKDPYNRLLARGARLRVDSEIVRDIALTSSGLLNPKVGGPSVFPPIPNFLMLPPASYGPKVWKEDKGADRYRRGMYTFRFRSVPYPALQAFDSPNGDFACVKRPRSNTPLQALTALNEPVFVECAQGLAGRILREGGQEDSQKLEYGFRLCVSRKPTKEEVEILSDLLKKERKRFSEKDSKPSDLLGDGKKLPENIEWSESATWVAVSRVLLNLDETITRE
jgi:hypothetical protein